MTPLIRLQDIYLKREDQGETGSAKDRAIETQVKHLVDAGYKSATISSTGNAAISADYFCNKYNVKLKVFVSPKVNLQKQLLITHSEIITTSTPISEAFKYSKNSGSYFLRQSTDPFAIVGYANIGSEIIDQLPETTSIFIPVGSGTTLLGISKNIPENVKLFAIQPASHCPIASSIDHQFTSETSTITDSLGAKLIPLKTKVLDAIKLSAGSALVVQDSDVQFQKKFLEDSDIITSAEGALSLAGYVKAKTIFDIGKFPVILLTGCKR